MAREGRRAAAGRAIRQAATVPPGGGDAGPGPANGGAGDTLGAIQEALLAWYRPERRQAPWRAQVTPYRVLVAECMLQQTQVARVAERFESFVAQFPGFAALAAATPAAVLRAWSGLGYNRRALQLQAVARTVLSTYGGSLPAEIDTLQQLPGIGPYTAAAIACFAFGAPVATVDTNIRRVLRRLLIADQASAPGEAALWALARRALPAGRASEWNQALMDLGALHCTARAPLCAGCPVAAWCLYRQEARSPDPPRPSPRAAAPFTGSTRYYRGKVLQVLTALPPGGAVSLRVLQERLREQPALYDAAGLDAVIAALQRDGLIALDEADGEKRVGLPGEGGPVRS